MKSIRVLHTLNWLGHGGMEGGVAKLVNGLDRSRFFPFVAALAGFDENGAKMLNSDVGFVSFNKQPGRDWSIVKKMAAYMKDNKIDIVHSHNWGAWLYSWLAAKQARVPVIIHGEHGRDTETSDDGRSKRLFKSLLARQCRCITTVSQDIADLLAHEWRLKADKICVIQNGIDFLRFQPGDRPTVKRLLGFSEKEVLMGTVIGSLRPVKDLPTLFQALRIISNAYVDWHFVVVGGKIEMRAKDSADYSYYLKLKKMVQDFGLADKVHFVGSQSRVEHYMQAFDIYINSSVYEGMSNTILEAMSCRAAIVATRVGGTPNIVENGVTGLLTTAKAPEELAQAVASLLASDLRRRSLADKAEHYVRNNHRQQSFIAQHEQLYKAAVEQSSLLDCILPSAKGRSSKKLQAAR